MKYCFATGNFVNWVKPKTIILFFCSMFKKIPCAKSVTMLVNHSRNRAIKEMKNKKDKKGETAKGKRRRKGAEGYIL